MFVDLRERPRGKGRIWEWGEREREKKERETSIGRLLYTSGPRIEPTKFFWHTVNSPTNWATPPGWCSWYSHHLGNYKDFRSSVPGIRQKPIHIFSIIFTAIISTKFFSSSQISSKLLRLNAQFPAIFSLTFSSIWDSSLLSTPSPTLTFYSPDVWQTTRTCLSSYLTGHFFSVSITGPSASP